MTRCLSFDVNSKRSWLEPILSLWFLQNGDILSFLFHLLAGIALKKETCPNQHSGYPECYSYRKGRISLLLSLYCQYSELELAPQLPPKVANEFSLLLLIHYNILL